MKVSCSPVRLSYRDGMRTKAKSSPSTAAQLLRRDKNSSGSARSAMKPAPVPSSSALPAAPPFAAGFTMCISEYTEGTPTSFFTRAMPRDGVVEGEAVGREVELGEAEVVAE